MLVIFPFSFNNKPTYTSAQLHFSMPSSHQCTTLMRSTIHRAKDRHSSGYLNGNRFPAKHPPAISQRPRKPLAHLRRISGCPTSPGYRPGINTYFATSAIKRPVYQTKKPSSSSSSFCTPGKGCKPKDENKKNVPPKCFLHSR